MRVVPMIGRKARRRDAVIAGLTMLAIPLTLVSGAQAASAEDLVAAKRAGFLGERIDGYLGVVSVETPADVRAMADAINARRREEYAAIAERQGVSVEAVAQLAGQKLIERASPGEWVLGVDGDWQQL